MTGTFLITIAFVALANTVLCQCPKNGLKIQSANCENPKNLSVNTVGCSSLEVKWRGNKAQTYIVKASAVNADQENATAVKASKAVFDKSGNCTAILEVTEGATINWSVEAVCSGQGIRFLESVRKIVFI